MPCTCTVVLAGTAWMACIGNKEAIVALIARLVLLYMDHSDAEPNDGRSPWRATQRGRGGMSVAEWATNLKLSAAERRRLEALLRDSATRKKLIPRARIALLSDGTRLNGAIAREAGVSLPTVHRWQRRYQEQGLDGLLVDKTRPPGTPPLPASVVGRVLELTHQEPPGTALRWSSRLMAAASGVSTSSVRRIWHAHGLAPHRTRIFNLGLAPKFAATVTDIVGLYVSPPQRALVLLGEDGPIRDAEHATPGRLAPGRTPAAARDAAVAQGVLAALETLEATSYELGEGRWRLSSFIRFLNTVDAAVPSGGTAHAVLDKSPIHMHPRVIAWLEAHPHWAFHYTPGSVSWLGAVSGVLGQLPVRQAHPSGFQGAGALAAAIRRFRARRGRTAPSFVWRGESDEAAACAVVV